VSGLLRNDLSDLRRWALCAALMVLAHAGLAAALATWQVAEEPAQPAAAIVIEFAPVAVAPARAHHDLPPGPEMVASEASPAAPGEDRAEEAEERIEARHRLEERRDARPSEEPHADLPPAPEALLEPPPQRQLEQQAPPRQEAQMPSPLTTAPQAITEAVAALPAAPAPGHSKAAESKAVPTWKSQLAAALERNKRYPPAAQARREQGVAKVFFSLDRQGRLIASRLVESSGAAALDAEALAILKRAQPFPLPPAELGPRVDLTVPIRFHLK
jgi:protein TonB